MSYVLFIFISLVWGASFILMKRAAVVVGPVTIAIIRMALGGLIIFALGWRQWKPFPLSRRDLGAIVIVAGAGFASPYVIQPFLVEKYGSGFIGMMVSFVPVFTIIVSVPLLRVRPSARQTVGVLVGLGCIGLLMSDGLDRLVPVRHLALALSVPLGYALVNTFVKRRFAALPTTVLVPVFFAVAIAALLPFGVRESVDFQSPELGTAGLALLVLAIFGTGLTMYAHFHLIQKEGPLFAGMVAYLIPVCAALWGWSDGEAVNTKQWIGLAGILISVAVVQYGAAGQTLDDSVEKS